MNHYIGLDVSMKETSVCVVDERGKVRHETSVPTEPSAIHACIMGLGLDVELIGLESGSLSHWLTEELLNFNLPVKCIDARHCAAVLSMQINKTDRNDARGLAEIMRCNIFREVQVKCRPTREVSAVLTARGQLVKQRTQLLLSVRGILKPFGIRLGSVSKTEAGLEKLKNTLPALELSNILIKAVSSLLETAMAIARGIRSFDREIASLVQQTQQCQVLKTIPGVGPVTALKYLVEISDPRRFRHSRSVGAYIGLTPTQYASGETQKQGRISKRGSKELRSLLVEAAIVLMTRTKSWSKLKAWGLRLQRRHGLKKAATAVARKLAVIMHRMLLTGEPFRFGEEKAEKSAA